MIDRVVQLEHFLSDYPAAFSRAQALDAKIMNDARSTGSTNYADLIAMATRQLFAAVDITKGSSNGVQGFLKDLGISTCVDPCCTLRRELTSLKLDGQARWIHSMPRSLVSSTLMHR